MAIDISILPTAPSVSASTTGGPAPVANGMYRFTGTTARNADRCVPTGVVPGESTSVPRRQLMLLLIVALLLAGIVTNAGAANEFYGLGGVTQSLGNSGDSYAWQLGYTQDLSDHIATSVCYLNEGHLDNHRRDGYSVQFWGRTNLLGDRLNLGIGLGPYLAFDTQATDGGYANRHSWRALTSAAATFRTEGALIFVLRTNYVAGDGGPDTISAMAGIGVQFRNDKSRNVTEFERADNEITLLAGMTTVNSLGSPRSTAVGVEYRRAVLPHLDWSVGLIDEGDNRLIHRNGAISQLWATQDLHHHRFVIGAGAGAYLEFGHDGTNRGRVSGILGLTGSYRITPHWAVRLIWDRVVTGYDRDADLILAGVGYKF